MRPVIVFGVQDFASLAHFYLTEDSEHEVVGFSVSEEHLPEGGVFEGLPVVDFASVEERWPPGEFDFFAPMSHRGMNSLRAEILGQIHGKGYSTISYLSSRATSFSNVEIGTNCFILEDNTLQPFTRIGDNVVLWSGNHIGHHSTIGDNAFLTSHVVVSGHCEIGPGSFLGVNATLKDGVTLPEGTFVAMDTSITKSADEPFGVYRGNPAERARIDSRRIC